MQQRTLTPESPVSKSWWSRMRWRQTSKAEAAEAERALLSLSPARLEATNIPIGTHKEQYLHCIKGGHDDNAASPHLVAVPGYGAGSGFMWRTLEGLSAGFRLWAVDMLGTGLSGRPHFAARSREEAETFFVDSFEKWRAAAGIEKMVLMGHSLGGYLSAVYAIKYPERVQHLVLVCPAGVARRPESWQVPEVVRSPWTLRGQVYRLAKTMWEGGLTPGTFVRTLGPWGPKLLEGYARKRFIQGHRLSEEEVAAFVKYGYSVLAAPGSGEFALRHLLEPFAFPKAPLEDRLHDLNVPITFIYGEFDWMDPNGADRLIKKLQDTRGALTSGDLKIITTPNAGHYNYMDQPGVFLEQVLDAVGHYLPMEARARVKAAAAKWPFSPEPPTDTKAELEKEMERNPAAAEAHVATDM